MRMHWRRKKAVRGKQLPWGVLLAALLVVPLSAAAKPSRTELSKTRIERAGALYKSGQHDEAIKIYSGLIEENPNDLDSRVARGRLYAWKGIYPQAEQDLLFVLAASPKYGDAWSALLDVYAWSGQHDKGLEAAAAWMKQMPGSADAHIHRARIYRNMRQFPEARKDLKKARELDERVQGADELARDLDRIPAARPWEVSGSYETSSSLPYDRADWTAYYASVRREHPLGSTQIESVRAKLYSLSDRGISTDNYFNLWRRSYGNLYYFAGLDTVFFPKTDLFAEVYQGFGQGGEISGSYRYTGRAADNADQYGAALSWYAGSFYLRGKTTLIPKDMGLAYTQNFSVKMYLQTVDDFIEASGGFGKDVWTINSAGEDHSLWITGARVQKFIGARFGVMIAGTYQEYEKLPPSRSVRIQAFLRI